MKDNKHPADICSHLETKEQINWEEWNAAESREDKAEFNRKMHETFKRIKEEGRMEMLKECTTFMHERFTGFRDHYGGSIPFSQYAQLIEDLKSLSTKKS